MCNYALASMLIPLIPLPMNYNCQQSLNTSCQASSPQQAPDPRSHNSGKRYPGNGVAAAAAVVVVHMPEQ